MLRAEVGQECDAKPPHNAAAFCEEKGEKSDSSSSSRDSAREGEDEKENVEEEEAEAASATEESMVLGENHASSLDGDGIPGGKYPGEFSTSIKPIEFWWQSTTCVLCFSCYNHK